ncbi:MAG TPA: hypothetical protein VM433_08975 [Mycobacteriales bacterium]|nr:hypothetical protein [Mycobacteriales bacterium]
MTRWRRVLLPLVLLAVASCAHSGDEVAQRGQAQVDGLEAQLVSVPGVRTLDMDYTRDPSGIGSVVVEGAVDSDADLDVLRDTFVEQVWRSPVAPVSGVVFVLRRDQPGGMPVPDDEPAEGLWEFVSFVEEAEALERRYGPRPVVTEP